MDYIIGPTTLAMLPIADMVYQTKILDRSGTYYSKHTCRDLLNAACLRSGASYRGKRDAIRSLLNLKQNVPIPLCFKQGICAIPSGSPQKWECVWYFYAHIKDFRHQDKQTLLIFHNHESLLINCSVYQTQQQIMRAGHILSSFQLLQQET
ncbi:competence protein ComK [Ectobacillus antri]|jgi:competence protein ComK|uniref:competence protein ComK n=1 Tax=Ectobacillus antri TaxID=2486280 RepID=UPI0013DDD440|nr:competence protein ComK [Ectobacillus antri]